MKNKISLVIMAAGMGSRYGGLKQIDPIDEYGNLIIDFSIFDGIKAGFDEIVFIIKKEFEKEFKEVIGNRIQEHVSVKYVFQDLNYLPIKTNIPKTRTKPLGTAHAIYCCRDVVEGSFAAINADDYYGQEAFAKIFAKLLELNTQDNENHCMVGYNLKNTLSKSGSVARGICKVSGENKLLSIEEKTKIQKVNNVIYSIENDKKFQLEEDTIVSMNLWGFSNSIFNEIEKGLIRFFKNEFKENPNTSEFYIPLIIDYLLKNEKSVVDVLNTSDKWYGITYAKDKDYVVKSIRNLKDKGLYTDKLWN